MDIQVLRFQNKKLAERLEERVVEEENLKIQIEEYKKRERDNTELLSVIHRSWNQVKINFYTLLNILVTRILVIIIMYQSYYTGELSKILSGDWPKNYVIIIDIHVLVNITVMVEKQDGGFLICRCY